MRKVAYLILLTPMGLLGQPDISTSGVVKSSPSDLINIPKDVSIPSGSIVIPKSYDLSDSKRIPPPLNQGDTKACTAFALAYVLKTFQEAEDQNYSIYNENGDVIDSLIFSPSYLFKSSKKGKNCKESGISLSRALMDLMEYGAIPMHLMPFNPQLLNSDCSEPNEELINMGRSNRIYDFHRLSKSYKFENNPLGEIGIIDRIKINISNHNPVVFACYVNKQYIENTFQSYSLTGNIPVLDVKKPKSEDYHAMVIIGYSDSLLLKNGSVTQAFKIIDSWKQNIFWMTYDVFNYLTDWDIYVAVDVPYKYQSSNTILFAENSQLFNEKSLLSNGDIKYASGLQEHFYFETDHFRVSNLKTDYASKLVFLSITDKKKIDNSINILMNENSTQVFSVNGINYEVNIDNIDPINKTSNLNIIISDPLKNNNSLDSIFPITLIDRGFDRIDNKAFRFQNIEATLSFNGLFIANATQANNRLEGWHGRLVFQILDQNGNILTSITTPSYGQSGRFFNNELRNEEVKNSRRFETLVEDYSIIMNARRISVNAYID